MNKPKVPPRKEHLFKQALDGKRLQAIVEAQFPSNPKHLYPHWDELRRLQPPPNNLTHEEWWLALKLERTRRFRQLPLKDDHGEPFQYVYADKIIEGLHKIDLFLGGTTYAPKEITNSEERKNLFQIASLIEEAITSSQIEGAVTTRKVAKEMILTGRKPKDYGEKMVLNNFITMQALSELKEKKLSKDLVFEIHKLITEDTIKAEDKGRFRTETDNIQIVDQSTGETVFIPPDPDSLEERMQMMCDFANAKNDSFFLHPVLRAITLHFWLAYDHPFIDGNGRTARALFYWAMLHYGYTLTEFISVSHIILKSRQQYYRSFLYTETDENDLTYFIVQQLTVIDKAITALHEFISRQQEKERRFQNQVSNLPFFNKRQLSLIAEIKSQPNKRFVIKEHKLKFKISYGTARADFLELEKYGIVNSNKIKKTIYFMASNNLDSIITKLEGTHSRG